MTINLQKPDIRELKPKITVFGVGGGGGNAVNNMINGGLEGVEFVCANTDAQALTMSKAERVIQLGHGETQGLGAGSQPEVGRVAAEECLTEIQDHLAGTHMAFVTAGMGGGTGTGAAPVVARAAREMGILTVGVVTKPFQFEGGRRMSTAEEGILELQKNVDTLIVIPNQNLFRIANDKTTFADAFGMADQVLYSGVACITDLMVKEGLINLDFADVRSVMHEMGKAMMGTGEASGEGRAMLAAEAAISNPLLDETSMDGAQGLLISITGGRDMTLFEVDEAATRIREEVDSDANIIVGATFDESLDGIFRVSVVATGIDNATSAAAPVPTPKREEAITKTTSLLGASSPSTETEKSVANSPITTDLGKLVSSVAEPKAPVQTTGVKLEPLKMQTLAEPKSLDTDLNTAIEEDLMPSTNGYVPPAASSPVENDIVLQKKMPAMEDFPPMVRETARVAETKSEPESGPMTLLQKLKSGLGVSDNSEEKKRVEPKQEAVAPAAPLSVSPTPAVNNPLSTDAATENPYAPKRGSLDNTGRSTPAARPIVEDDQLDIPAFLRRQG